MKPAAYIEAHVRALLGKGLVFLCLRAVLRTCRSIQMKILELSVSRRRLSVLSGNHGLRLPVIVSLTSYRLRFPTLHLTLISLLTQAVVPDRIQLWLTQEDIKWLPPKVRRLERYGLEILPCEDLRSYKKIIPTLRTTENCFIVTADDDIYYNRSWLKDLVVSYRQHPMDVVCHRAHRMTVDDAGRIRRYLEWEGDVSKECVSRMLMPTTGAGVLYSPEVFDSRVTDSATFLDMCPTADDIWLYWMLSLRGSLVRVLGGSRQITCWRGSQQESLWQVNVGSTSMNDLAVSNLVREFGKPMCESRNC